MTNEELLDQAAVMIAAAQGAKLQYSFHGQGWHDCVPADQCSFDFSCKRYRVRPEKPKPRDFYLSREEVEIANVGGGFGMPIYVAHGLANYGGFRAEQFIHVREVIED